jgi:hypothetical protein
MRDGRDVEKDRRTTKEEGEEEEELAARQVDEARENMVQAGFFWRG